MFKTIRLSTVCPFCGKTHYLEMLEIDFEIGTRLRSMGVMIQDAFPMLSPSDREFLLTGICDECWENMGEEE